MGKDKGIQFWFCDDLLEWGGLQRGCDATMNQTAIFISSLLHNLQLSFTMDILTVSLILYVCASQFDDHWSDSTKRDYEGSIIYSVFENHHTLFTIFIVKINSCIFYVACLLSVIVFGVQETGHE